MLLLSGGLACRASLLLRLLFGARSMLLLSGGLACLASLFPRLLFCGLSILLLSGGLAGLASLLPWLLFLSETPGRRVGRSIVLLSLLLLSGLACPV